MLRRLAVLAALVALALAGGAGWLFHQRFHEPYQGYAGVEQFVEVRQGDSTGVIGRALVDAGVVRDRWSFRAALWLTGAARQLKAGEYRFDRPMTAVEVVERVARGEVYLRAITFPEGLTIAGMSRLFEERGLGTASSFAQAARDVSLVAELDPAARDLEGYLFPETYNVPRRAGATELVGMMVARFRQVFTEPLRQAALANGLSVRQAVTLASLVEKETSLAEERPTVAAVYLKRRQIGMPLQCDPTVIYALEAAGRYNGNLTKQGLAFDSPYNTYRRPGLPPGPIAAPGRTSLEAAARPADGDYLYFVSRNDGSHAFARTLAEHNRNVHRYQVQYFRRGR